VLEKRNVDELTHPALIHLDRKFKELTILRGGINADCGRCLCVDTCKFIEVYNMAKDWALGCKHFKPRDDE